MYHRNKLINLLIEKDESDQALMVTANQRYQWYQVNLADLDPDVRKSFYQLDYDQETEQFLNNSMTISNNLCLQFYYSFMATIFSFVLTKTSINGLLSRGSMFVFSRTHLRTFLSIPDDWSALDKRIIDIGAGDGAITTVLKQFFNQVNVVEASRVMEWRLSQRGFHLIPMEKWRSSGPYNLISALNLLDRHHDPNQLLDDLHFLATESNCPVLLSIVLPINQFVEFNPSDQAETRPKKLLISTTAGHSFEKQVEAVIQDVFLSRGFQIIRWTKLPYLCEGDLAKAFYRLDDAVFLLKAVSRANIEQKEQTQSDYPSVEIHTEM